MMSNSQLFIFTPKLDLPDFKLCSGGVKVRVSEYDRNRIKSIAEKRKLSNVWERNLLKVFMFISIAVRKYRNQYGFVEIPRSLLKYLARDYDDVIQILLDEHLVKVNNHGRDKKTGVVRGNAYGLVEDIAFGNKTDYVIKLSKKGIQEYNTFINSFSSSIKYNYNNYRVVRPAESIIRTETFSHNILSNNQLNDIINSDFEVRYQYLEYVDANGRIYDQKPAKHKTAESRYYH